MSRSSKRFVLLALMMATLLAGSLLISVDASAGERCCPNCRPQATGHPDLFYNYYVPGTCGGVPAQLYLSPRPVPAHVGHTYITYQPLMPHEALYPHKKTYYRYYDGGRGLTRTSVRYWTPPLRGMIDGAQRRIEIAR